MRDKATVASQSITLAGNFSGFGIGAYSIEVTDSTGCISSYDLPSMTVTGNKILFCK